MKTALLGQVIDEFTGMAAFNKGQRDVVDARAVQSYVQVGVGANTVKAACRNVVGWAFVLNDVVFAEHSGDVLFDKDIGGFFDDNDINPQGFGGKLILRDKLQSIAVLIQFHLNCFEESWMTCDLIIAGIRAFGFAVGAFLFALCVHGETSLRS